MFLNLPFSIWGVFCLVVAIVYAFISPKPKVLDTAQRQPTFIRIILRWFHSLVWVFLAAACFLWAVDRPALANMIATFALPTYIIFLITMLLDQKMYQAKVKVSEIIDEDQG